MTGPPASRWTCPGCDREFGRRGQSHLCVPAGSLEDFLDALPEPQRLACEAVLAHLESLGDDVHVEAVTVGVLVKRARTFVELRPQRGRVALSFLLSRTLDHARITRVVRASGTRGGMRIAHFVRLTSPDDVDDLLCEWLAEAYHDSPA